jgi:hypothetical protein
MLAGCTQVTKDMNFVELPTMRTSNVGENQIDRDFNARVRITTVAADDPSRTRCSTRAASLGPGAQSSAEIAIMRE